MRIPTLHLNGTGKEMLLRGYTDAYHAIRQAEISLSNIEFNPRDYYVQGSEAWQEANNEMQKRFEMLNQIKKEIDLILESLDK